MDHVVFFSESSGDAAFRRVPNLEEAVRLVESLRNERGITDVALHALTPVPVSFRTYYRVEIGGGAEEQAVELAPEPIADEIPSDEVPAIEGPGLHLLPPPSVDEFEPFDLTAERGSEAEADLEADVEVPLLVADPVEVVGEADTAEPTPEWEPASEWEAPNWEPGLETASATSEGATEEFGALGSYEPLVPQVRPEPEAERSLGYFAR